MPIIDANRALYELSAFPVASPSYHAVESTTFNIALGGNGASLLLRLANDEVAGLVDDEVAFVAAQRLHGLGLSPAPGRACPGREGRAVFASRRWLAYGEDR
ncbi:hypothetical protein [Bradyrhizobium sp. JR3.5]